MALKIGAGELNQRVALQRKTTARDDYGEPIETWATWTTRWAKAVGGAGGERITGQQVTGRGRMVFVIRYSDPEPQIDERVLFRGRTFDINDVDNDESRNRWLVLTCTEVTG